MSKTRVVLRADSDLQIGMGHLSRLIALGGVLKDSFDLVFITSNQPSVDLIVRSFPDASIYISQFSSLINEAEWIASEVLKVEDIFVFDGYLFDSEYQLKIKKSGASMVGIDDIHSVDYVSDVVINHSGSIDLKELKVLSTTRIFTGPQYSILRFPFIESVARNRISDPKKIFICLGGADQTESILQLLSGIQTDYFSEISILTSEFTRKKLLESTLSQSSKISFYSDLDAENVFKIMKLHGTAICSASTIAYEFCSVGGLLFCIQTADNQKNIYKFLITAGLAFPHLNLMEILQSDELSIIQSDMMLRQSNYFDGKAGKRLKKIFLEIDLARKIVIRKTKESDVMILYQWVNDPDVRKASYNQNAVSFDSHSKWLEKKLSSDSSFLYIFEIDGIQAGQIRFDILENEALISYLIDSRFRGFSLGDKVLKLGIFQFKHDYGSEITISGFVKNSNIPSVRAFEKTGFDFVDGEEFGYPDSIKFFLNN